MTDQDRKIFVGNIPLNSNMEELKAKFAKHGQIVNMNMQNQKGFTFITYDNPQVIKKVISIENGSMFCGSKLAVRQALKKTDITPMKFEGPSTESQGEGMKGEGGGGGGGQSVQQKPAPVSSSTAKHPSKTETPNDVEIICMMKNTRNWAEFIEGRLKNMGLRVDVLFPNPDISIGKVLGNIAMRGVMFAVCVSPDNEMHRSMTVNVLQGEQQEHRNMPLDEAISFISRRYFNFVEKGTGGAVVGKSAGGGDGDRVVANSSADRSSAHKTSLMNSTCNLPVEIQRILEFLTQDRPMSIMEYDKLIRFLVRRREATLKEEYGSNIPAHLLLPPVGPNQDPALKSTQEEIQNRVIEILNKKRTVHQQAQHEQRKQNLDPTLQQAIDNLVSAGPNLLTSLVSNSTFSTKGSADVYVADSVGGSDSQLDRFYANMQRGGGGSGISSTRPGGTRDGDWD